MKKSSFLASLLAGIGLVGMPTNMNVMPDSNARGPTRSRHRSRIPFGNTFTQGYGSQRIRINLDTGTRAGVPGSKLVRKAAENRLGLYSGAHR